MKTRQQNETNVGSYFEYPRYVSFHRTRPPPYLSFSGTVVQYDSYLRPLNIR